MRQTLKGEIERVADHEQLRANAIARARLAEKTWLRALHSVKFAVCVVALISSFGIGLASGTPQREASPLEQGTIGPLHLGMTVQQVESILGPAVLRARADKDWSDTLLFYTDGAYGVGIGFERPYLKKDFKGRNEAKAYVIRISKRDIGKRDQFEYPDSYIRRSLRPIASWKWLGKSLSYPPVERHPKGFSYNYYPNRIVGDPDLQGPFLTLESKSVEFQALGTPVKYYTSLEAIHQVRGVGANLDPNAT